MYIVFHFTIIHVHVLYSLSLLLFTEEEQRLKLEEEERIQALLDMSEDEYEGLSSTRQREIDTIRQQRYLEKKRK